jgi:hypothetical protein
LILKDDRENVPIAMNAFWTYRRQFSAKKERFKALTLMEKIPSGRE